MAGGLNQWERTAPSMFADWISGSPPATAAAPASQGWAQRRHLRWDWADPRRISADEVSTDRRNDAQRERPIYGSLELSAATSRCSIRCATRSTGEVDGRDPTRRPPRRRCRSRRRWGDEPIWTSKNNVHNPCSTRTAVAHLRQCDLRLIPTLQEGSSHPSAKLYPLPGRTTSGRLRSKTKQITHISTCFGTHHLMFAEDANHALDGGGGQVVGWLNRKMFDETHDEVSRRAGHIVMDWQRQQRDACVEPTSRSIRRRTSASAAASTRSRQPDGGVGIGARHARRSGAVESRSNPPGRAGGGAATRSTTPRRRCGAIPPEAWTSIQRRRLGRAGERASGELRPPRVQGPAQRSEGDGAALPRGMDSDRVAAAAIEGRDRIRQRGSQLLHVGGLARLARAWRQRADRHWKRV